MRRDSAVYWNQGLFLTAQHLQQQDLFHQTRLGNLWSLLGPNGWGVRRLDIRHDGLMAGLFEVTRCEIVTRDGHVLRAGTAESEPNARLAPRAFDGVIDRSARVGVWIALPHHTPRAANVAPDGAEPGAAQHRWRLSSETVWDLHDPQAQPTDITFLDAELSILFETEPAFAHARAHCEVLRIAELVPGDVSFTLAPAYIPPSVSLDSCERLLGALKDLTSRVTRRALDFADLKRERGIRGSAGTSQDVMRTLILTALNRHVAELGTLIEEPWTHPQAAYAQLRRIVAELSSFSEDYTVFGAFSTGDEASRLPAYDHENIALGLDLALNRIDAMLKRLSAGPEAAITLDLREEVFSNVEALPEDFFRGEGNRYYLVIESDLSGRDLSEALFSTGKLCSPNDLPALRKQHLFGLPVEYLPVAPEELPQRSSRYTYFRLDTSTYHWTNVREERAIALYSPTLAEARVRVRLVRTTVE